MSKQPKIAERSLAWKLASIRRNVEAVERRHSNSSDDDAFTFPPADRVFDVVRKQLQAKHVLALPTCTEYIDGPVNPSRVRVTITFINEDKPAEREMVEWIGQSDHAGKAATATFKGALLASFLIRTPEPEPRDRHEARAREVKKAPAITPSQRRRLIAPLATEAGLSDEQLLAVAADVLGTPRLDSLDNFPGDRVDDLVAALNKEAA